MAGMAEMLVLQSNVDSEGAGTSATPSSCASETVTLISCEGACVVHALVSGTEKEFVALKPVAVSNTSGAAVSFNLLSEASLAGKGEADSSLRNKFLELEKGKNLAETRPTEKVQVCAICHDKIKAEDIAEIKGCEHAYCVTCILQWASYKTEPWCPQCRLPFSFLYVYRALDGTLSEYLFEESVCLLLRAFWFKPLVFQEVEEQDDYQDDYDAYEEPYYASNLRLGNRRWGDSGYVRAGRREARPVNVRQVGEHGNNMSSSSRQEKGKEPAKQAVGRRARRAQKREQADNMSVK